MNKKKKIFLVFVVIIFCTALFSCTTLTTRIEEGIHVSENGITTKDFVKGKYIIKEISLDEYNQAGGKNVFIDASSKKTPRYLSLQLYLLSSQTQKYELVTVTNLKYLEGTGDVYKGDAYLELLGVEYNSRMTYISSMYAINVFTFDSVFVHEKYKFTEGTYQSVQVKVNNNESQKYESAKVTIKEITKDEYDNYNENVFVGQYDNQYIHMELFIYDKDKEEYVQISFKNITYGRRTKYEGEYTVNLNGELIEGKMYIQNDGEFYIKLYVLGLLFEF